MPQFKMLVSEEGGRQTEQEQESQISYLIPRDHPAHPPRSWSEIKGQVGDSSLPFTSLIHPFSRTQNWEISVQDLSV